MYASFACCFTVLPPCKSGIDLGLLIDGSESILEKNLRLLLRKFLPKFLKKQFKKGTIRKDATRVGVVKFDSRPEVLLDFKDKLSYRRKKLVKMLKETPTDVVYETRIDRGLKEVRRKLFSKRGGDRKNSPNVLVLFTDGKPFPPDKVEPFNQTLPPLRVSIIISYFIILK